MPEIVEVSDTDDDGFVNMGAGCSIHIVLYLQLLKVQGRGRVRVRQADRRRSGRRLRDRGFTAIALAVYVQ